MIDSTSTQSASIDWSKYGHIASGEIAADLQLIQKNGTVIAELQVENLSKRALHLFTFNVEANLEISLNGKQLLYIGPLIDVSPGTWLYTTIEPGKKTILSYDLHETHNLPHDAKGTLVVKTWYLSGIEKSLEQVLTLR